MGQRLNSGPNAGFSLIELLVAAAVMAVLATGAVLSVGRVGPSDGADPDMALFRDRFQLMQALAVEGRATRGLVIGADGPRIAARGQTGWDTRPATRAWRGQVTFARRGGATGPDQPDILFLLNGRTTAFTVSFAGGGWCESDGWTGLTCVAS